MWRAAVVAAWIAWPGVTWPAIKARIAREFPNVKPIGTGELAKAEPKPVRLEVRSARSSAAGGVMRGCAQGAAICNRRPKPTRAAPNQIHQHAGRLALRARVGRRLKIAAPWLRLRRAHESRR